MKLLSYALDRRLEPRLAIAWNGQVVDVMRASLWLNKDRGAKELLKLPSSMRLALAQWDEAFPLLKKLDDALQSVSVGELVINERPVAQDEGEIVFFPPVPDPPSVRDFYAFEQHVKTARGRRNLEMVPEWYEFPAFYFTNPNALLGHQWDLKIPAYTSELDFELEIACIIAGGGRDIQAHEASNQIAGYTIFNDWSARDIQRKEMKVGLGPAKGKDFASSLGPYLVTADEFNNLQVGKGCNVEMIARRNGQELSRGNWKDISFSFAEMIARASEAVNLLPGDILGSGTVGTGCILELGPENTDGWLKVGDVLDLEIQGMGTLSNRIT